MIGHATYADIFRTATLILGSMTVAASLATAWFYAHAFLRWRRNRHESSYWQGLLPLHVFLVTTSYAILCIWSMQSIMEHLHHSYVSWRVPIGFIAYGIGLASLWAVLGSVRARAVDIRPNTEQDEDPNAPTPPH